MTYTRKFKFVDSILKTKHSRKEAVAPLKKELKTVTLIVLSSFILMVVHGAPQFDNNGAYQLDNSGTYKQSEGQYHPDNTGEYRHDVSGAYSGQYIHDNSGSYFHDNSGDYIPDHNPYIHQEGNNGLDSGNVGGSGGFGGGRGNNGGAGTARQTSASMKKTRERYAPACIGERLLFDGASVLIVVGIFACIYRVGLYRK
ncbi:hypothetical protein NQ317_004623 [Molorchus minor]|uniref:Uncharacterized protein n=1 Tax=Molorchus minor TaxID=1323400 RepID=A0ABQ9JJJ3_9CUCU|nr:hypothetical protein NQ317_004623 [Molorchus minor]